MFACVMVVLTWKSSFASLARAIPCKAPSKAPGTFRNASWDLAVAPSILTLIRSMPESIIFRTICGVSSVPLVAMVIRKPRLLPYCAISKTSGRSSGSPPVKMMIGLATSAISSITLLHSVKVSSPS